MTKKYVIEIRYDDEVIKTAAISINKNNLNDMVMAIDYISDLLLETSFAIDGLGKNTSDIELLVYSKDHILFQSLKALNKFKQSQRIETRLKSNMRIITYVNGIPYHGKIEKSMIVQI